MTPQEREPEGRARAELAEVWSWLQRIGLVTVPYDKLAARHMGQTLDVPRGDMATALDENVVVRPGGQKAKRSRGKETVA
jgi:hypothetical protein